MTQFGSRFLGGISQFTPSSSPYGVTIQSQGNVLSPARVTDMQNMGIFWCRFFVNWATIETGFNASTGAPIYDWSLWDDAIAKCNAVGINFVATIQAPPTWRTYGWAGPVPPASGSAPCDTKNWALPAYAGQFASDIATRYNGGAHGQVAAIESANEGYDDGQASCQNGKFVIQYGVQQAVYNAVKAVNSAILVGAPAELQINKTHITQWAQGYYGTDTSPFGTDGGQYNDYHQLHFYPGQRGPNTDDGTHATMQQYAQLVINEATKRGHANKGIWFTETGYAQNNMDGSQAPCNVDGSGNPQTGYAQQSCLLQETLDAGRLSNGLIDKVFLYTLSSGDGYSPIHGQSPEVFEAGYNMYVAYTAQYPVWTGGAQPAVLAVDQSTLAFAQVSGGTPPPAQNVTLSDTGGQATAWTSSIAYGGGADWLTLTPSSGNLSGNSNVVVAFSASAGVLDPGTYTATVTFTAVSGGSTAQVVVTFIVSPASSALLTLYGTNVASVSLTHAGQLAQGLGGTEVQQTTAIGAATGFGEMTALGTGSAWPALAGPITSIQPTGKGWTLDGIILDNQTMGAGAYTCVFTLRFGGTAPHAFVADLYVRVWRYDRNLGTYSGPLATFPLLAQNIGSNNKVVLSFPSQAIASQAFAPGQTLYIDCWPNVTSNGLSAGANAVVYESSVAGAGLSADVSIGFPGYAPTIPPLPASNTYSVLIGSNPVTVEATTLSVKNTIGKRGEATMTVYDPTGSNHLQQYQRTSIYDKNQNLVFSGYITSPVEDKPGFQPLLETQLTATDQHWLADKRIVATYYLNKTVGYIVTDLVSTILSQEGVTIGSIVDAGAAIPQVTFSYCSVAAALDAMVTQASSGGTPYFWMIDQFKALWFVPYTAISGPSADGTSIDDGHLSGFIPKVTRANPKYLNTSYVTGGNAATSSVTETRLGDSHTRSWTMGYPLAQQPDITVDGNTQQVGLKGSSGFDFYWAPGDPVVTQSQGNPVLTSSNTMAVTYVGQYPSVFTGKSPAQIAYQQSLDGTSGIVEVVLNDNTIASVQDGLNRVGQQLSVYGVQGMQFQFQTLTPGYAPGQLCTVNYPPLGLNNLQMLVEEVDATDQQDGYNLWYQVNAIIGPYDANWQQFFGAIRQQGLPNDINVGQSGGSQIPTPNFTMAVATTFNFSATVGTAWYPSNTSYPSTTLYPSTG